MFIRHDSADPGLIGGRRVGGAGRPDQDPAALHDAEPVIDRGVARALTLALPLSLLMWLALLAAGYALF